MKRRKVRSRASASLAALFLDLILAFEDHGHNHPRIGSLDARRLFCLSLPPRSKPPLLSLSPSMAPSRAVRNVLFWSSQTLVPANNTQIVANSLRKGRYFASVPSSTSTSTTAGSVKVAPLEGIRVLDMTRVLAGVRSPPFHLSFLLHRRGCSCAWVRTARYLNAREFEGVGQADETEPIAILHADSG